MICPPASVRSFRLRAQTHTSVPVHDAIQGAELPVIELHDSNLHKRKEFRHHSFTSPVARVIVVGLGVCGPHPGHQWVLELSQEGSRA
jgi:3-dehydroquinate dehydratase-2